MGRSPRQNPGVIPPPTSLCAPPWANKPVVAPLGYPDDEIEWVPMAALVTRRQSREQTAARPMLPPGPAYPALIVGPRHTPAALTIEEGHHRYLNLLDSGWRGRVPVVHRRR